MDSRTCTGSFGHASTKYAGRGGRPEQSCPSAVSSSGNVKSADFTAESLAVPGPEHPVFATLVRPTRITHQTVMLSPT